MRLPSISAFSVLRTHQVEAVLVIGSPLTYRGSFSD